MTRQLWLTGVAAGLLLGGAACHHCKKRKNCDDCPPTSGGTYLGEPVPGGSTIPPTSVPASPPMDLPADPLPPPVLPENRSFRIDPRKPSDPWDPAPTAPSYFSDLPPAPKSTPAPAPTIAPAPAAVPARPDNRELLDPDPLPGGVAPEIPLSSKPSTSALLQEPIRPTDLPPPPGREAPKPAELPSQSNRMLDAPGDRSPVGLPGFAPVPGYDRVATGGKPTLDGFDWLKRNGYKTVVYLHAPSTDFAPARDLAEARGLRFVPIAVAPATLARAYDEFAAAVTDANNRPLYVADEDGGRAGGLWYLQFRTRDLLADDAARLRAAPLGLTEATTEEQKRMWIAIQDVLAKQ